MRLLVKPLTMLVAPALALVTLVLLPAAYAAATPLQRSYGSDRISTAAAASRDHRAQATDAVVATAADFPDALSAAALAGERNAPVLLTAPDRLSEPVADELDRLGVERVWLLGGSEAVSDRVEYELVVRGHDVTRLAGTSRYETAAEVARATGSEGREVILALGEHRQPERAWADAVASAALSATPQHVPTLLTRPDALPGATEQALEDLATDQVIVVGGEAAISQAVTDRLATLGYRVRRIAGASRYETSIALADEARRRFGAGDQPVVFASGRTFPDSLAAGALAAQVGGPLVLVPPQRLADSVDRYLREHDWTAGVVVGGPAAASERVLEELTAALRDQPRPSYAPPPPPRPQSDPQPPREQVVGTFEGEASWYGPGFAGRRTASGEPFNPNDLTAAHRTLAFGTRVRVTNTGNGAQVIVRVNDRGPYHRGRVIDVSQAAADRLGMRSSGTAHVRGEILRS